MLFNNVNLQRTCLLSHTLKLKDFVEFSNDKMMNRTKTTD